MLKSIRLYRDRSNERCYYCRGSILYKPKAKTALTLDVQEEHLAFLHDRKATTIKEMMIHALLVHENVHSERYSYWNSCRYRISPSFRLHEEKLAYEAQIAQLIRYKLPVWFTYFAKSLSGPEYGNIITFNEAHRWVKSVVARESDAEFMQKSLQLDAELKYGEDTAASSPPLEGFARIKDRIALVGTAFAIFAAMMAIALVLAAFGIE